MTLNLNETFAASHEATNGNNELYISRSDVPKGTTYAEIELANQLEQQGEAAPEVRAHVMLALG